MYIPLLPTSFLPASILLETTQIISLIVNITHQTKEDIENQGKHHDDYGTIDNDAKENVLGENEYFDGFDENENVTS